MTGLHFGKLYKKFICIPAVFITVFVMIVGSSSIETFAASPTVSVQIASAQNGAVSLESETEATAIVFLDCSDLIFKVGGVKVSFDSTVFCDISVKSDADFVSKIELKNDITSVRFNFDSANGVKGTVQLGTISFKLNKINVDSVKSDIKLSEAKFIDSNGNTHADNLDFKSITVTVNNKDVPESLSPSATNSLQNPVETPVATGESGLLPGETPKPTSKTEILTDTAMYTLEDVEDLSRGAVVFWGILFMIVGVWIGLGLGYWIWYKRKGKPQVKDSHRNVIGHL